MLFSFMIVLFRSKNNVLCVCFPFKTDTELARATSKDSSSTQETVLIPEIVNSKVTKVTLK